MRYFIALLLFFAYSSNATAQALHISGFVNNSTTTEPIPFVNIYDNNKTTGVFSDINGYFSLHLPLKSTHLIFSAIGYSTDSIHLKTADNPIYIKLKPKVSTLEEVVIKPGINPALVVIKKAIENRKRNNPDNLYPHQFNTYNKTTFEYLPVKTDSGKVDSNFLRTDKILEGGYFALLEAYSKTSYLKPGKKIEQVQGNKVSGFKSPKFAALATELQPFGFYNTLITLLEKDYLNPISKNAEKSYIYELLDTLYQNQDTIYLIRFQPKKRTNVECLKGELYINTKHYAIQNVTAKPTTSTLYNISIEQQYKYYAADSTWFPYQLNYKLISSEDNKLIRLKGAGQSLISDVDFNPKLDSISFSGINVDLDKNAGKKDSIFWGEIRPSDLNEREATTYEVLDSLGSKYKFDRIYDITTGLSLNKIALKYVDLSLKDIISFNEFEGISYGLGAYTNNDVSNRFSIGGYIGSNVRRKNLKYGGKLKLFLSKNQVNFLTFAYDNTLFDRGNYHQNSLSISKQIGRNYLISNMEKMEKTGVNLQVQPLQLFGLNFHIDHAILSNNYSIIEPVYLNTNSYRLSTIGIDFRYAIRAKKIKMDEVVIEVENKYPVIKSSYSKALKLFNNEAYTYNKVEFSVSQTFSLKKIGNSKILLKLGYLDKALPDELMFTGEGSKSKNIPVYVPQYFQTVLPYEFTSNRYVHFFFSHNFKNVLLSTPKFKPQLFVQQNIGFSDLIGFSPADKSNYQTMGKGFWESGIILGDLVKANYVDIALIGLGGGVFYRYGNYALPSQKDNFTYKVSLTINLN